MPKKRLSYFMQDFLKYAESTYAQNNVELYERYLRRFKNYVGDIFLDHVTIADIDKFKALRLREAKPTTVSIELRTIKSAFQHAVRWKLMSSNPCDGSKLPRIPDQAPSFILHDEMQTLLTALPARDQWFKDIVLFALLMGLRRSELCNLKWSNIDMNRRILTIESSDGFHVKAGKRRTIPIGETAYSILVNRFSLFPEGYVFKYNGQPVNPLTLTHKFKVAARKAGLDDRIHFHSLRHSCASWLAADGVSIYHIAKLLGHTTVSTTEKFYAHLQPESLRETVNRIAV
ncbi:MAG: tyrosine-type recombinase/integrase [bacterium]|nr:tyrosine-type recombinase/integrase [bacterium]